MTNQRRMARRAAREAHRAELKSRRCPRVHHREALTFLREGRLESCPTCGKVPLFRFLLDEHNYADYLLEEQDATVHEAVWIHILNGYVDGDSEESQVFSKAEYEAEIRALDEPMVIRMNPTVQHALETYPEIKERWEQEAQVFREEQDERRKKRDAWVKELTDKLEPTRSDRL